MHECNISTMRYCTDTFFFFFNLNTAYNMIVAFFLFLFRTMRRMYWFYYDPYSVKNFPIRHPASIDFFFIVTRL